MSMMGVEVVLCYLFLINFAKTCDLYNQCCSPTIRGCMCDQGCNCITFGRLSSLPPGSEIQISLVVQRIILRTDQHVILEKEAMWRVNISTCLGMCFSLYFFNQIVIFRWKTFACNTVSWKVVTLGPVLDFELVRDLRPRLKLLPFMKQAPDCKSKNVHWLIMSKNLIVLIFVLQHILH